MQSYTDILVENLKFDFGVSYKIQGFLGSNQQYLLSKTSKGIKFPFIKTYRS